MKIVTILGARPQFIKSAMISREISKHKNINEHVIHTGQHFDENMSKIFFTQMNIPKPKYNLNINSLSHGAMTGRQIEEIEKVLLIEKPNFVIVYGDINDMWKECLKVICKGRVRHCRCGTTRVPHRV